MHPNIKFIILLAIIALISSSGFFFFPEIDQAGLGYIVAIAFGASLTQLGAVWYFLSSLRSFKKGLVTAYILLAVGIFVFSWVLLVPSISVFWPFINSSDLVNKTLVTIPYLLGALGMYLGMRRFAKLLDSHDRWSSWWFALVFSAVVVGIVVLLPHPPVEDSELSHDLSFGSLAWSGAFGVAAMMVALHIRKIIGLVYKNAMTWMAIALGALALVSFHEFIIKVYFLDTPYVNAQVNLAWYLLVGILFLRAGVAFKETGRESVQLPKDASHVDVVVNVAQMVSKPQEIDKVLDKVRAVTAQGSQELSQNDKTTLLDVYLHIENYLVTSEPLHKFTKEGLRNGLPDNFLQDLLAHKPEQASVPGSAS